MKLALSVVVVCVLSLGVSADFPDPEDICSMTITVGGDSITQKCFGPVCMPKTCSATQKCDDTSFCDAYPGSDDATDSVCVGTCKTNRRAARCQ